MAVTIQFTVSEALAGEEFIPKANEFGLSLGQLARLLFLKYAGSVTEDDIIAARRIDHDRREAEMANRETGGRLKMIKRVDGGGYAYRMRG
jgi:hypothetical protein